MVDRDGNVIVYGQSDPHSLVVMAGRLRVKCGFPFRR